MARKRDGIKNPEVREFVYREIPQILNMNEIFVKVYGEDYARKRTKSGIVTVYTNETKDGTCEGYHMASQKSITICYAGPNGSILTPNDIINNKNIEETVLHESIHAILERTRKESRENGVKSGSGILERYSNGNELGRGLNEGFTEWLCEKCGFESTAYPEHTNFVRLIELAIGTEKTMELGKGNIYVRIPELLEMNKDTVIDLLCNNDNIYKINENLQRFVSLRTIVEKKIEIQKNTTDVTNDRYNEYLEEFAKIRTSEEYLDFLDGREDSDEVFLEFFKDSIKELDDRRKALIIYFESAILDRYFTKDIEQIMNNEDEEINKEDFEKISKIVSVLSTSITSIPERAIQEPKFSSIKIKEDFEKFKKRYIKQYGKEAAEEYKNGKLPLKNFVAYGKKLGDVGVVLPRDLIREFSRNVNSNFEVEIGEILSMACRYYDKDEFLEKIRNTTILKLEAKDKDRYIFSSIIYSDDNFYDRFVENSNIVRNGDEVDSNLIFDFTDGLNGEEYKLAMKNFLELRRKTYEKNPDSEIHINSREVIIDNGEEFEFYHIEDGELIPMEIGDQLNLEFTREEKEEKETDQKIYTPPIKVNKVNSFINTLRRKIFEYKNRGSHTPIDYATDDKRSSYWKNTIFS